MLGWVLGACAIGGLTTPVAGQGFAPYPPLKWLVEESEHSHPDAHDEGRDIVYWFEDGTTQHHWIYVTGFITEMSGNTVVGTRFATFKYDAAFVPTLPGETPPREGEAFFPPPGTALQAGQEFKAVAMAVDPLTGDIYVTGEGPGAAGQDYFVVKYDKELNQEWASSYNGPGDGDDIPVDIVFVDTGGEPEHQLVVVTGTSLGDGTSLDIATVAWHATDADPGPGPMGGERAAAYWPNVGWGDGVRRYNGEEDGDDRAVELAPIIITVEDEEILSVVVLGTSWGGSTGNDYTTHVWSGAGGSVYWDRRYEEPGEDVARGLWVEGAYIFVTGSSENGNGDLDFATVHYSSSGTELWVERHDYMEGDDVPCDIRAYTVGGGPIFGGDTYVWVTGGGMNGSDMDVVNVRYLDDGTSRDVWSEGWADTSADFNYGKAAAFSGHDWYIAGSLGYSNLDEMLALAYYEDSGDYNEAWYRTSRSGSFTPTSVPHHEGRGIVVMPVDTGSDRSIFITGVSRASGEGRQFATWRYKE